MYLAPARGRPRDESITGSVRGNREVNLLSADDDPLTQVWEDSWDGASVATYFYDKYLQARAQA